MDQTASPLVFKSPISGPVELGNKNGFVGWVKKNIVKIIITLLIIGIVAELIFGGVTLFSPSTIPALPDNLNILAPKAMGLTDASLSLVTDKTSYKKGELVVIKVKLFTGGYTTDSTDLVIKYDPAFLSPEEENFFALAGNLYSEYPAMQVDKEQGQIGISGITVPGKTNFNGVGIFATLYFTSLKDGQTKVSVDFEKGATADSNVVLSGSTQDILGLVENADVFVSGTDLQPTQKSSQSCNSFTQACLDASGDPGIQECTGGSTKNGSCGYDSKFTESCGVCELNNK